jgi:soluble P-type ATPase
MEMNVEENNVMRISKRLSPVQIMVDLKHVENVEYLVSVITNDVRCMREVKCRIAMAQASFNKRKAVFTSKLDFNLRNELGNCYIWRWNFDNLESRPLIPGKF